MYDDDITERIERIETYLHGLFNAVTALAHELTGKQLLVILRDADGSNPRNWVPNGPSAVWREAEPPSWPADLTRHPASHRSRCFVPDSTRQ